MSDIHFTNTNIPTTQQVRKGEAKYSSLKNIFPADGLLPKVEDRPKRAEATGRQRKVNHRDLRTLSAEDLKDHSWEAVKSSRRFAEDTSLDMRAMRPAAGDNQVGEYDDGANRMIPGAMGMVFDPNNFFKSPEERMSLDVVKDAKDRRDKRENRHRKPESAREEWEQIGKAKSTSTTPAGTMGFTPVRSALKPAEFPEVKLKAVEKQKEFNEHNRLAGIRAANMKKDLDKIMMDSMHKKMAGDWSWEAEAQERINDGLNREVVPSKAGVEFAPDMVKPTAPTRGKIDLSGIFKTPVNPAEVKDDGLRRSSTHLKDKRKSSKDDRSWERVNAPSKLGKF